MPSWHKIMGMDARVPAAGDLPDRGTQAAVATTVGRGIRAVAGITVDRRTQGVVATIAANPTSVDRTMTGVGAIVTGTVDTTMTQVGAMATGTVGLQDPTDITVLPMRTALRIMDLTIAIRAGTTIVGVIGM